MPPAKRLLASFPGIAPLYRSLRRLLADHERIFSDIYRKNKFGGKESVSGPGSDLLQTRVVIQELPILLQELSILKVLDIPCGDCHWIAAVRLDGVEYTGADVVRDLIVRNRREFAGTAKLFLQLNLVIDPLPDADLILCRDCLVHFSFKDTFSALRNICRSKSKYLLTTTFVDRRENQDILSGDWHPLNLEAAPFSLPRPLKTINEGCTVDAGRYGDKSLGLWRVQDICRTFNR